MTMNRRAVAAAASPPPSSSTKDPPGQARTTTPSSPPASPTSHHHRVVRQQNQHVKHLHHKDNKEGKLSQWWLHSSKFGWFMLVLNVTGLIFILTVWMEVTAGRTTVGSSAAVETTLLKKQTILATDKNAPSLVVTSFDKHCYMMDIDESTGKVKKKKKKKKNRNLKAETETEQPQQAQQNNNIHRHLADSGDFDEELPPGHGKPDKHTLGPCVYEYPQRLPPTLGYLQDIDWFHFREQHNEREACLLYCVDQLPAQYWKATTNTPSSQAVLLNQAVAMGLPRVVDKLKNEYNMDPMQVVENSRQVLTEKDNVGNSHELDQSNAIQQAIRMGNAEILAILTDHNADKVIDDVGRTVKDYITMKASPIRPRDAKKYFGVDTTKSQNAEGVRYIDGYKAQSPVEDDDDFFSQLKQHPGMGWSEATKWPISERCDMDIVYGSMSRTEFYNDYFLPGRPFVLRGVIPAPEIAAFSRKTWEQTKHYSPDKKFWVGPTAYPSLTGQEECDEKMSIAQLEAGENCPEAPDTPILHAWHPTETDFVELFPSYENGNIYDPKSGWRKLGEWFYPEIDELDAELGWQVFFGGDESGATLHWHNAAFNVLYVGIKEWKVTPPWYRGFSGMPTMQASKMVDPEIAVSCTQRPGDFVYIPNYWGHLTMNHGFTIGAAVIMSNEYQQYANPKPRIHFVHINKTGGSSIIKMLRSRCEPQFYDERWEENGLQQRAFHATAHALMDHYGRDNWDNSYNFVVVRHPLARVVSNFFFLVGRCMDTEGMPGRRKKCKERLIPTDDIFKKSADAQIAAFHKYFHKLYETYPPASKEHHLFGSLGHGNEVFDTFNATQTSWVVDDKGEIAVDHIFHLETLSDDFDKLAQDVPCLFNEDEESEGAQDDDSSEAAQLDHRRLLEMRHDNPTQKYPDYKLFRDDKRTNEIMKEVFWMDYKNFGYEY